jgi:hypothetical protein
MTANHSINRALFLSEHLERAEPDLLRSMLKTFIEALMGAEADALCGAAVKLVGEHTEDWLSGLRRAMADVDTLRTQGPEL